MPEYSIVFTNIYKKQLKLINADFFYDCQKNFTSKASVKIYELKFIHGVHEVHGFKINIFKTMVYMIYMVCYNILYQKCLHDNIRIHARHGI